MLAFISLPLTGSVFAHKPTFLKQRSLRMFPPTAYGASMLAQEVPLMVACAIIFSGGSLLGRLALVHRAAPAAQHGSLLAALVCCLPCLAMPCHAKPARDAY